MKRNTEDDPKCDPLPPPFAVGTRVRYKGTKSIKIGDTDPTRPNLGEPLTWLALIEPGMEVTITEAKLGRRGTGKLIDPDDDIIDCTDDGYSVYRVQGKHRTDGRIIWPGEDAAQWEVLPPAAEDVHAYRVTLICDCQNDAAYGLGPNPEAARIVAEVEFTRHHGKRAQYTQIITEHAVPHDGGSHYEFTSAGMRYAFTDGLGSEIDARAVCLGYGETWAKAMSHSYENNKHPYTFETTDKTTAYMLLRVLNDITVERGNAKLRASALKALTFLTKVARVVFE